MLLLLLLACEPRTGFVDVSTFDCDAMCWKPDQTLEVPQRPWRGYLGDGACDDVTVTFHRDGACHKVSQMCDPTPWEDPAVTEEVCCEGLGIGAADDLPVCGSDTGD